MPPSARSIKHMLRSVARFRNWPEIVGRLARDAPPTRAVLRDGTVLHAPENSTLLSLVQEVFVRRLYTPEGFELGPDDVVVDVGANIGTFTVFAARGRERRVYAVEPFPENAAFVRRNAEANGLANVRVIEAALAGRGGTATLYLSHLSGGHLLFDQNVRGELSEALDVPALTLAEVMERHGLERIDFLKLDCEGAEGEILEAAGPEVLGRVRRIAMEFHDNVSSLDHDALARLLEEAGFATRLRWNGRSRFGYLYAARPRA